MNLFTTSKQSGKMNPAAYLISHCPKLILGLESCYEFFFNLIIFDFLCRFSISEKAKFITQRVQEC